MKNTLTTKTGKGAFAQLAITIGAASLGIGASDLQEGQQLVAQAVAAITGVLAYVFTIYGRLVANRETSLFGKIFGK